MNIPKNFENRMNHVMVVAAMATTMLAGCGQSSDNAQEFASLATVVSESRGPQHENAGGLETNVSTTLSIDGVHETVDSVERLEGAGAQQGSSKLTLVNRADRVSRQMNIVEPSSQLSMADGNDRVEIRVDNLNRIFVNGRAARDANEAARIAYDISPAFRNTPLPIIAEADRRLGAVPEHRGFVVSAIKWIGRKILQTAWCRMKTGNWTC